MVYNFVYYLGGSLPAGIVSDRRSRRSVSVAGLVIFALVYAGFAVVHRGAYIWPLFAVYGLSIALTQGVSRALLSELAPAERRASVLGVYGMLTGLAARIASVAAGQRWDQVRPAAPFMLGAGGAAALRHCCRAPSRARMLPNSTASTPRTPATPRSCRSSLLVSVSTDMRRQAR